MIKQLIYHGFKVCCKIVRLSSSPTRELRNLQPKCQKVYQPVHILVPYKFCEVRFFSLLTSLTLLNSSLFFDSLPLLFYSWSVLFFVFLYFSVILCLLFILSLIFDVLQSLFRSLIFDFVTKSNFNRAKERVYRLQFDHIFFYYSFC